MRRVLTIGICVIIAGVTSTAFAEQQTPDKQFMVSAAHPLATFAGLKMLERGGSAVDAAVAVQTVLNLVEPQSSGIGGGAFMLFFNSKTGETVSYDGRESAPRRAREDLFLTPEGQPKKFSDAVRGGLSVGTPGTVALLETAHAEHGKLPWSDLFDPAIQLAEHGFPVAERLALMLPKKEDAYLRASAASRDYFYPDGSPLAAGAIITNPDFAETLKTIAREGAQVFYEGDIAQAIVNRVQRAPKRPGLLNLTDLSTYEAIRRAPVCHPYRIYRVCGMGPPSSGALAIGQILGILEHFDLRALGAANALAWHLIAEASKLAFADRNHYVADPDFVEVPVDGLLNPDYLESRAKLISTDSVQVTPVPFGQPPGSDALQQAADISRHESGTSHFSIVDQYGNAVSMTTTIEGLFGSQLMVDGFMLNNELTDFSFLPERDGKPVANRVEPRKRPRSSMSPTLVFGPDDTLRLVIGSPGGSRIIGYVVKTLIAVLDWDMDVRSAIELGNVVNRNGATELEKGSSAADFESELASLGHKVQIFRLTSGLHGIEIIDGQLRGGADPRREGIALGN